MLLIKSALGKNVLALEVPKQENSILFASLAFPVVEYLFKKQINFNTYLTNILTNSQTWFIKRRKIPKIHSTLTTSFLGGIIDNTHKNKLTDTQTATLVEWN